YSSAVSLDRRTFDRLCTYLTEHQPPLARKVEISLQKSAIGLQVRREKMILHPDIDYEHDLQARAQVMKVAQVIHLWNFYFRFFFHCFFFFVCLFVEWKFFFSSCRYGKKSVGFVLAAEERLRV